eukprot:Nk52_evm34s2531 gene=Nk52_evmTU34s2531
MENADLDQIVPRVEEGVSAKEEEKARVEAKSKLDVDMEVDVDEVESKCSDVCKKHEKHHKDYNYEHVTKLEKVEETQWKVIRFFQKSIFPCWTVSIATLLIYSIIIAVNVAFVVIAVMGSTWPDMYDAGSSLATLLGLDALMTFLLVPKTLSIFRLTMFVNFERIVNVHIWLGRITFLVGILHGLAFLPQWKKDGVLSSEVLSFSYLNGFISLGGLFVMNVTSLPFFRRRFREVFMVGHLGGLAVFIICGCLHKGAVAGYLAAPLVLYLGDYAWRFYKGHQRVELLAIPDNSTLHLEGTVTRLAFRAPKKWGKILPGSYVYVRYPKVAMMQWHPFTISHVSDDGIVYLHIRSLGGWTYRLAEEIKKNTSPTTKVASVQGTGEYIFVEGPHGNVALKAEAYRDFLLVCGGIGCTPMMMILNDLVKQYKNGRLLNRVVLVWSLREVSLIEEFAPQLMKAVQANPDVFRIHINTTLRTDDIGSGVHIRQLLSQRGGACKDRMESKDASLPIIEIGKRPDIAAIIDTYYDDNVSRDGSEGIEMGSTQGEEKRASNNPLYYSYENKVAVLLCGPNQMIKYVTTLATRLNWHHNKKVQFQVHKEVFSL